MERWFDRRYMLNRMNNKWRICLVDHWDESVHCIFHYWLMIIRIRGVVEEDDWCSPSLSVTVKSITYTYKCSLHIIFECETEKNEITKLSPVCHILHFSLSLSLSTSLLLISRDRHWTLLFHPHHIKLIFIPNVLRVVFFSNYFS